MSNRKPIDTDNDGKPFDEDAYFRKAGLTKPERTSRDKWDIVRERYKSGHIANPEQNAFDIRSANEWMEHDNESDEPARQLFGDFWLEGELCILFADTAKGKSILATQIGESIAHARRIKPFSMTGVGSAEAAEHLRLNGEKPGIRVLYIDFELSETQFRQRYSGIATAAGRIRKRRFHPGHFRCQIKNEEVPPAFRTLGDFFAHSIRHAISEKNASVLIVDNISWLRTSNTNASSALALMQELKTLKSQMGISILVLAHTPKRPFARPLTVNDLAGSKMLANFADTIFAIGDSVQGTNIRYLKQVKPRNTALKYDATNVAVARVEKPSNFLKFTFTGNANEAEHLIRSHYRLNSNEDPISAAEADAAEAESLRKKLIANCRELNDKGISNRQIAELLGLGTTTVRRYLSEPPA